MTKKNKSSIMKKMTVALIGGLTFGLLCLLLREYLITNDQEKVWDIINRILFKNINEDSGFNSLGLFYIIGQLFMRALQLAIVPLILSSLSLSMCSMSDPQRLGKIAGKTVFTFLSFYVISSFFAGTFAFFIKSMGWFSVSLPTDGIADVAIIEGYNPLTTIIAAIPNNLTSAMSSNNSVLSIVVVSIIIGLCMNKLQEKADPLKKLLENISDIIQIYMDILINKFSPIAIFCMLSSTFATYGVQYIVPTLTYTISTIIIGLVLLHTIYPIGIYLTTGLNPWPFIKKTTKIGLFAAATNSSAATLPLNRKTCIEELGCSDEISNFVLPTGMTINMNGTTVMHMMAVTFIATSAGIDIQPYHLILTAFLSISTAIGTPAIPVAGTTMVFAVLSGLGFTSDLVMVGYALVLAMNYIPGMAVITMNVVGDAATAVIVSHKENELEKDVYYDNKVIKESVSNFSVDSSKKVIKD